VRDLVAHGPVDGILISWWARAAGWSPSWRDATGRTDAAEHGPYTGPDTTGYQPVADPAAGVTARVSNDTFHASSP
jgi:hypothetical protein